MDAGSRRDTYELIILSHFDHIGRLNFFPCCNTLVRKNTYICTQELKSFVY